MRKVIAPLLHCTGVHLQCTTVRAQPCTLRIQVMGGGGNIVVISMCCNGSLDALSSITNDLNPCCTYSEVVERLLNNDTCLLMRFGFQGLNLKRGEAFKAASSWGSALYGLVAILLLTPLMAIPVQALPFAQPELAFGLAVFCCVPTALSSGVTLTQV